MPIVSHMASVCIGTSSAMKVAKMLVFNEAIEQ